MGGYGARLKSPDCIKSMQNVNYRFVAVSGILDALPTQETLGMDTQALSRTDQTRPLAGELSAVSGSTRVETAAAAR